MRFYLFPSLRTVPSKGAFIDCINELWKNWPRRKFKAQVFYGNHPFAYYSNVLVTNDYSYLTNLIADRVYQNLNIFNSSTIYAKLEYDKTDSEPLLSRTSVQPYREFIQDMRVGASTFYTFNPELALASLFDKWREKYLPRGRAVKMVLKELVPRQA